MRISSRREHSANPIQPQSSRSQITIWTLVVRLVAIGILLNLPMNGAVHGQAPLPGIEVEPIEEKRLPGLEIDVEALLLRQEVFEATPGDEVWVFEAQRGRSLVQVPLRVTPIEEEAKLGIPSIKVRGGRFLAWRIVPHDLDPIRSSAELEPSMLPYRRGMGRYPGGGSPMEFEHAYPTRRRTPSRQDEASENQPQDDGPPPDVPMFTRELIVRPDGTISWQIDRFLPGGHVVGDTSDQSSRQASPPRGRTSSSRSAGGYGLRDELGSIGSRSSPRPSPTFDPDARHSFPSNSSRYALKIRPEMLEAMRPQRPRRDPNRRGVPQLSAADRRAAHADYRWQEAEYRKLRTEIRALPEQFDMTMPSRLWALFEIMETNPDLGLSGDSSAEGLPWRVRLEDLDWLREVATGRRGGGRRGRRDSDETRRVAQMEFLASENHPLTHRLIANALSSAGMIARAEPNDPLYRLLRTLISSKDKQTRVIVTERLAALRPQTTTTAMLLRDAWPQMEPDQQVLALPGLLQVDPQNSGQLQSVLTSANQILASPSGPDAGAVLEQIVWNVGSGSEAMTMFVAGMDFEKLSPQRRDQAIAFVVRTAGTEPLAGAWLNHRLLGSHDPALRRRTLELIAISGTGSGALKPVVKGLVSLVFGPAQQPADPSTKLDLQINQPAPLDSASHSLYRAFNSGDAEIRELAWKSLPAFVISDGPLQTARQGAEFEDMPDIFPASMDRRRARWSPRRNTHDDQAERFDLIMDAALSQEKTPSQLAGFLARQPNRTLATEALVKLVMRGDPPASAQAARKLLGTAERVDDTLAAFSPADRGRFASLLYKGVTAESALVAGLLRQPEERPATLRWFAEQITLGTLPSPDAWADQYRSEDELLILANSTDEDLAAGAAGALVAAAGGDEQAASELAAQFSKLDDREITTLQTVWEPFKRGIYAKRLQQSTGSYRLMVFVRGQINASARGSMGMGRTGMDLIGPPGGGMGGPGYEFDMGPMQRSGLPFAPDSGMAEPSARINLGIVELVADGQTVHLANDAITLEVPERQLAIRIGNPGELKNFENEELAELPLEDLYNPLDLLPERDGSWRGREALPDGRLLEVALEPIGGL